MNRVVDYSLAERFFQVSPKGLDAPDLTVSAAALLDTDTMNAILRMSARSLKSWGMDLPASFFGLAFFGLCGVTQLFLSLHERFPLLPLHKLNFQLSTRSGYLQGGFQVTEISWQELTSGNGRRERTELLSAFYRETVTPVVEKAAACANVHPSLIWNQYGARMRSVRDYAAEAEAGFGQAEAARFLQDYELLTLLPGECFGLRKNPYALRPRYIEDAYRPGKKTLIRSACCLYYRREDGVKCHTCPLLTKEEREIKLQEIRASQPNGV